MMTDRMFIHTKVFDRLWESLGCDDDDLAELQKAICENPLNRNCSDSNE